MAKSYRKGKSCYLCGVLLTPETWSLDHIPPKALFPKSERNCQLITVPCCQDCNNNVLAPMDEVLMMLISGHSETRKNTDEIDAKVFRSVAKGGLRKHVPHMLASRRFIGGVEWMDLAPSFSKQTMIERIVKGLLYKYHRVRDFSSYKFMKLLGCNDAARKLQLEEESNRPFFQSLRRGIGVFRADWMVDKDDPRFGGWYIQLYEGPIYFLLHGPNDLKKGTAEG